jgi:hypothetical protein
MAWRIQDHVLGGYLNATKRNTTHGVLEIAGMDRIIPFSLVGDAGPSLIGRAFDFFRTERSGPSSPIVGKFATQQHGVVGSMYIRAARVPVGDYLGALARQEKIETEVRLVLHLEWFGPKGRVVMELIDPRFELDEGPPLEPPAHPDDEPEPQPSGISATSIRMKHDMETTLEIVELLLAKEEAEGREGLLEEFESELFEEVEIASSSEDDFTREMEIGERMILGEGGDFLSSMLEPQRLPKPDDITEEQAETLFKGLLIQLVQRSVMLHLCVHATYREGYRYMLELLHEERVPKEITGSGWTMNYNYGEICPACAKEWEDKLGP